MDTIYAMTNIAIEYLRTMNKPKSNDQKEFKKKGFKTTLTSGANLKSILSQNMSKLFTNSYR